MSKNRIVPSLEKEQKLWRQGYTHIAGVDEVGRGAWAGPIVAAAVVLPHTARISGLRDSKQLSEKRRRELFWTITHTAVSWGVGAVPPDMIDTHGIVAANRSAMHRALTALGVEPDHVLSDAFTLQLPYPCDAIVRGDTHVASIAAASVVAKVWRDHTMRCLDRVCAPYGFAQHKGYGTRRHEEAIVRFGITSLHRKTFVPSRCFSSR